MGWKVILWLWGPAVTPARPALAGGPVHRRPLPTTSPLAVVLCPLSSGRALSAPHRGCITSSCPPSFSSSLEMPSGSGLRWARFPGAAGAAGGFPQAEVTGKVPASRVCVLSPWQAALWDFDLPKHWGGGSLHEDSGGPAQEASTAGFSQCEAALWCFSECFRG